MAVDGDNIANEPREGAGGSGGPDSDQKSDDATREPNPEAASAAGFQSPMPSARASGRTRADHQQASAAAEEPHQASPADEPNDEWKEHVGHSTEEAKTEHEEPPALLRSREQVHD